MKKIISKISPDKILIPLVIALVTLAGAVGWILWYQKIILENEVFALERSLNKTEKTLADANKENDRLYNELTAEQQRLYNLQDQVEEVIDTVSILDKLSKTDEELLQKYSKVFFLNEHYIPPKLTDIPLTHLYNESVQLQIHSDVWPNLKDLILDAENDGITLWINSAYRSFGTQSSLKSTYIVTYGSEANAFSADQGYSEHQLGTTVDFTTNGIGGSYSGFEGTPAHAWLIENAYKYGFVLSYPEDNSYYIHEPWHWRFIGKDLARKLYSDGIYFYSMDQRKIDEYLINIFD